MFYETMHFGSPNEPMSCFLPTWQVHNMLYNLVSNYIVSKLSDQKLPGVEVFSDLKGFSVCGGSIPPSVISTEKKPDIFIVDKNKTNLL